MNHNHLIYRILREGPVIQELSTSAKFMAGKAKKAKDFYDTAKKTGSAGKEGLSGIRQAAFDRLRTARVAAGQLQASNRDEARRERFIIEAQRNSAIMRRIREDAGMDSFDMDENMEMFDPSRYRHPTPPPQPFKPEHTEQVYPAGGPAKKPWGIGKKALMLASVGLAGAIGLGGVGAVQGIVRRAGIRSAMLVKMKSGNLTSGARKVIQERLNRLGTSGRGLPGYATSMIQGAKRGIRHPLQTLYQASGLKWLNRTY